MLKNIQKRIKKLSFMLSEEDAKLFVVAYYFRGLQPSLSSRDFTYYETGRTITRPEPKWVSKKSLADAAKQFFIELDKTPVKIFESSTEIVFEVEDGEGIAVFKIFPSYHNITYDDFRDFKSEKLDLKIKELNS